MARKPSTIRAEARAAREAAEAQFRASREMATKDDLRALDRAVDEAWADQRAELEGIVNRVGRKIAQLRSAIGGSEPRKAEFIAFRNALYELPEDDREAAVDDKLTEWGVTDA